MNEQVVSICAINCVVPGEAQHAQNEYLRTGLVAETYIRLILGSPEEVISVEPRRQVEGPDAWRRSLLEQTNVAFQALRENQQDSAEECNERKAWDVTLADGLEND